MAREAHSWALAAAAMLEGHIECLHCSTSCGNTRARNILLVACAWGANSTQGVRGILVDGSIGVIENERPHQRAQAVSSPLPPAWYKPRGR